MVDNLVDEYAGYYESDTQSGQPLEAGQTSGRERDMAIRVPSAQWTNSWAGWTWSAASFAEPVRRGRVRPVLRHHRPAGRAQGAARADRKALMATAAGLTGIVELSDRFYDLQAEIDSMGRIRNWDSTAGLRPVSTCAAEVAGSHQMQPVGGNLGEAHPRRLR